MAIRCRVLGEGAGGVRVVVDNGGVAGAASQGGHGHAERHRPHSGRTQELRLGLEVASSGSPYARRRGVDAVVLLDLVE